MDTKIVKTQKIVSGGNCLAKINNKNVFIPYALPDEILEIKITQQKNDYDIAQIVKIIEPSPYRVNPPCKYYTLCGGCNMMHINQEHQKELRVQILKELFLQQHIELQDKINIISKEPFNYRNRFQFTDGGLSQKNSNNIIKIEQCLCADKNINQYLQSTKPENRVLGRSHFFASDKIQGQKKLYFEQQENHPIKNKNHSKVKNNHFAGTILQEQNIVSVELNNKIIKFDVRGFFQSNLEVFEEVLTIICNSLPNGQNVLDLYSGCGSISAFLADKFTHVTLVEHNRDAIVFAEQNMQGKNHTSFGLSGESWVKNCSNNCKKFDACVVDPPRSGIEKPVLDYLCKSKIPFIRYLSCDPVTQARDIQKLLKSGYNLEQMFLLDFYPNTSHIETLAILNLID